VQQWASWIRAQATTLVDDVMAKALRGDNPELESRPVVRWERNIATFPGRGLARSERDR